MFDMPCNCHELH